MATESIQDQQSVAILPDNKEDEYQQPLLPSHKKTIGQTIQETMQNSGFSPRIAIILVIVILTVIITVFQVQRPKTVENFTVTARESTSGPLCLQNPQKFDPLCQWYFLNYTPSAWENAWYSNIDTLQNQVCETLANAYNLNKTSLAIERMMELQRFGRNRSNSDKQPSDELFSKMFYRQECIDPLTNVSYPVVDASQIIEPLIGLLRDPLTVCAQIDKLPRYDYEGANIHSKRFFLLSVAAPYYVHSTQENPISSLEKYMKSNKRNQNLLPWTYQRAKLNLLDTESEIYKKTEQNILIDLGSSYFGNWGGDSSAAAGRWFYEHYKRFGIRFDRIIAYEHAPLNQTLLWEQLPDDVFPVYTFINRGCDVSGKFNPWETVKRIAKPHDHVIIKLDIDTPAVEAPLVNQLLKDPSIHSLVDEFFFEHHINVREMNRFWGQPPGTLKDSYILFSSLRKLGIRMHSWP